MDWKSLIFPLLLLSYVNCYDPWKSSLVFVIDDTGSMSSIISQVKSYAKSILQTVVSTKASQIENFVLVTFNDYDHWKTKKNNTLKRIVTTEPELFEQALNGISVDGGWDCPEYSLSGIKLALEESLPRSYVYVFTDAAAKDYTKYEEVKNLALKKSTQISFIISGSLCKPYDINPEQYLVYNNLADATSGQVFTPEGTDISNILIFVEEVMKGRMGELAKQDFPPGRNHAVLYPKEKFTGDVFVMIMGILLDIDITDPDGKRPYTTDIVRTDDNRVIKVESEKNGIFVVTLSCSTDTKVVVEGRTTIDFQHGFQPEHSKNNETTVNPLPDVKSRLYIFVNIIQGGDIKLTKVQLLDSSGNVLQSYPLKPYDSKGRVYVTEPFEPPKQTFRVMVVGLDVGNNSPVIRLAPTATEPESVRPQIVVDKTQFTVSKGETILRIPCHASGYPTPTITWEVDGKPVQSGSKYLIVDGALLVRSPDEGDTRDYTCIATNTVDKDRKTFRGIVDFRPKILVDKTQYTAVEGDKVLRIPCRATGFPTPSITWEVDRKRVASGSKYSIVDGTLLVLRPDERDTRDYTCIATNKLGEDRLTFKGVVELRPKILVDKTQYTAVEGDKALRIPCRATGSPAPSITWEVDGKRVESGAKYSLVEGTLVVHSPRVSDTRDYTCVAASRLGADRHTVRGVVELRPKIVVDKTQYTSVEGDKALTIPCRAIGSPAPSITWEVDGKRVESGAKYSLEEGVLVVYSPRVSDTRDYTCVAASRLGTDRLTVRGVVELRPKILVDKLHYTAVEGDKVLRIPCRATGSPAPSITWEVDGKRVASGAKYSLEEGALVVHSPRVSDTRDYTCVAASRLGADRLSVRGVVELRPKIVVDKTQYTAVEGDKVLRIPCRATGSPAPSITWEVDGKRVESGAKYSLEGGALIVHSPRVSDTRDYTCVAASRLGADRLTLRGVVELHPKIILEANKTKYTALEGDEVLKIPCHAIGAPTPSITWDVDGKRVESGSKYSIVGGTLFVLKPDERDTRDYTCIATNKLGEDRITFKGVVEREITSFDKINKLFLKDGSTYKLECGLPHSESDTVRWFEHVEGLNDTGTTVLTLLDTTISQSGKYSCRVSNKDGYSMITYDVNFGRAPVFSADADEVVEWWGVGILNCLVKAEPPAKVQWYREGKLMETPDDEMQKVIPGWGHYSCNVSNIHGSVERRFVVVSADCLIHKREEEHGHQPPIIASESGILFSGKVKNDYHIIPRQMKLILSCRNQSSESNSFKSLPGLDEVQATCVGEDKFLVNGKEYKYSDLQCTRAIEPLVIRTGEKCINDNTEIVKVGYQLKEFTEVYRVCMDLAVNRPLYSQLIDVRNEESSLTVPWQTVSGFDTPRRSYGNLQCETSTSKCCLSNEQLVKANDVPFGAAQRSTFIENVNTVLYWRNCNDSRNGWDELKNKLSIYTILRMWSGASDYNDQGVAIMPKYLWKVVSTLEAGSMAIVYVNEKEPDDSQVLCNNVCPPGDDESFIESSDKYMYCCELSDFSKAFHIPESVFTM